MSNNLVPVGELKPRDFFEVNGKRMMKAADDRCSRTWAAYKNSYGDAFNCTWVRSEEPVQPLPDCDSFDWQPPREPTALELAKAWLQSGEAEAGRVYSKLREIIAAMELEAKQ